MSKLPPIASRKIFGVDSYLSNASFWSISTLKFLLKVQLLRLVTRIRLWYCVLTGKAYVGPFKGEFGHLLGHVLPFVSYLHKKGVKVVFCGFSSAKPFFVDEQGSPTISMFVPIPDATGRTKLMGNFGDLPAESQQAVDEWENKTRHFFGRFDLNKRFFYPYVFRDLVATGHAHCYQIGRAIPQDQEFSCALFPRKKGRSGSPAQGEPWDFDEVVETLGKVFSKIYIVGHPAHVAEIRKTDRVEYVVGTDNEKIIHACVKSHVIFSPHSGVVYLGPLLKRKFAILYKGGRSIDDIDSLHNTLYYIKGLDRDYTLDYCFEIEDIKRYAENLKLEYEKTRN